MIEIILPAMGEGIFEAEITRWLVREGAQVEAEEPLVEVATDKVDSEIPSPGNGTLHKILLMEGDTAKVGQVLALIATAEDKNGRAEPAKTGQDADGIAEKSGASAAGEAPQEPALQPGLQNYNKVAFLSPVIRKLALENELSPEELQGIEGSGAGNRITKADVMQYLAGKSRPAKMEAKDETTPAPPEKGTGKSPGLPGKPEPAPGMPGNDPQTALVSREQIYGSGSPTVEEMDRMRKLIADHMVYSKQVSPHVTSFVECDVSDMIRWRERIREEFQKKFKQKLTVTTLILEAVIKALKQYPRINVSVDGYRIILKQEINLGMATALPDGNLIVPVIHEADKLNLVGLAARVNDLADRARANKLQPSQIQGGTFTVTNLGQFGNISGTPIINQPQVAILAIGAIVKKPAVVETPEGDGIGIRHMLVLSLAYDHRVVDGALGGTFLKCIGDHLQHFDPERRIG